MKNGSEIEVGPSFVSAHPISPRPAPPLCVALPCIASLVVCPGFEINKYYDYDLRIFAFLWRLCLIVAVHFIMLDTSRIFDASDSFAYNKQRM